MNELEPLDLNSPRWSSLRGHFDHCGDPVPVLLAAWHASVGSYQEEYAYGPLFESYLHQRTILDVAYAIVPHLVVRLPELDSDRQIEVLDHIGHVDAIEQTPRREVDETVAQLKRDLQPGETRDHIVQATLDRYPQLPDDLAPAYRQAIGAAKRLRVLGWGEWRVHEPGPHHYRRHLRYLRAAGLSDDVVASAIEVLNEQVGEALEPICMDDASRITALETIGWPRQGSCTAQDRLMLNAMVALAYYRLTANEVLELLRGKQPT